MTRTIHHVVFELGSSYLDWKSAEAHKNELRDEFFDLATQEVGPTIDQTLIDTPSMDRTQLDIHIARNHPGWRYVIHREAEKGLEVIIEEDPALKPFTYVDRDRRMVYGRQIVQGSVILDDERLREVDPVLWVEITENPDTPWLIELVCDIVGYDERWAQSAVESCFKLENYLPYRKVKPLETLDSELLARLQPYIYYSKPTVKLSPPRIAKPEELE